MIQGDLQHVTTRDACGDLREFPELDPHGLTTDFSLAVKRLCRLAREQPTSGQIIGATSSSLIP